MAELRVSTEILPSRVYRIDLDDFDAILSVLRAHCRTVRVMIGEQLLTDLYNERTLGTSLLRHLDIEAHEPFLRFKFGLKPFGRHGQTVKFTELAATLGESDADALFSQIEQILSSTRHKTPLRDWWSEKTRGERTSVKWTAFVLFALIPALIFGVGLACANAIQDMPSKVYTGPAVLVCIYTLVLGSIACFHIAGRAHATGLVPIRGRRKTPAKKELAEL